MKEIDGIQILEDIELEEIVGGRGHGYGKKKAAKKKVAKRKKGSAYKGFCQKNVNATATMMPS